MKGQVNEMEDGKKKIWICLLVIVLAAVVAGVFYYLSAPDAPDSEGFLIRAPYSICGPEGVGGEV
jgi:flagellar basal body-associated protein FliL